MSAPSLHISKIYFLTRALIKWPVLRVGEVGTFIRKEQPARWDPDKNLIFPPAVVLDFVKDFESQFTFLNYLTEEEKLPAADAEEMAQQLRSMLRNGLSSNQAFHMEGLGKITRTERGAFSFFTEESVIADLDDQSFGLLPASAARTEPTGLFPVSKGNRIPMKVSASGTPPPSGKRPTGWKFFLVAGLLITLCGLTLEFGPWDISYRIFSHQTEFVSVSEESIPDAAMPTSQQAGASEDSDPDKREIASTPSEGIAAPPEEVEAPDSLFSVQQASPATDNSDPKRGIQSGTVARPAEPPQDRIAVAQPEQQPVGDMGVFRGGDQLAVSRGLPPIQLYHLIAGSFNSATRAQQFVIQLKREGYDAFVLAPKEGSGEPHRVSIYRDGDRVKVASYADKLKQMGRQAGWVYAERSFE